MSNKSPWVKATIFPKEQKWYNARNGTEKVPCILFFHAGVKAWHNEEGNLLSPDSYDIYEYLDESLLESPARYSAEEYFESKKISMKGIHAGEYIDKEDFLSFAQSLPSKARKVNVSPQAKSLLDEIDAETVEKKFCKHNGVKRIGESCMRNNKCEYPKCLVSAPVDETDYLLSTKANRERLEESINQERAMEYANEQGINYPIDTTYQSMIKSQIQSAYLAGFTASKDYAKGLLEDVSKKIIGKLNSYCLSQDNKRLGLPVLDEVAMLEMTEIVCKLLNQLK
jgi:hypothetical protein